MAIQLGQTVVYTDAHGGKSAAIIADRVVNDTITKADLVVFPKGWGDGVHQLNAVSWVGAVPLGDGINTFAVLS